MNEVNNPIEKIKAVYFIGIGGIGMSALARYFHSKGIKVSGYDKTETSLTKELVTSGIAVHYNEQVDLVPKNVELVVFTPAIPKDHKELMFYQQNGYKVVKRSDVLQIIKFTPSIDWLYIWLTALLPPPPTPITFIMDDFSLGRSKCIIVFEF